MEHTDNKRYRIGFWLRFGAGFFDMLICALASLPIVVLMKVMATPPFIISVVVGSIYLLYMVSFLIRKSATPGCWLLSHQILDHKTGNKISSKQAIIRWFGAWLSALPLFLGHFWVIWDKNKRSWHDYLAGTVAVSDSSYVPGQDDRVWKR